MGAIDGAVVLDAFAGSGALGIEALSRGAASCTFVERDRSALVVVEANLASTGLDDRARVVSGDARSHLASSRVRHDLVLLDPPHDEPDWEGLLALVAAAVTPDAVVVLESDHAVVADADPVWEVAREKRYGGTVVQMVTPRPTPSRQVGAP
jgi:16S rRNA (guanine966-N2)-methyltransferase